VSSEPPAGYTTVPLDSLPKPHPKAQKALSKAKGIAQQTGANQAVIDTLNSVSFTIVGDDTDLNWAVAQGLSKRIGWFAVSTASILAGMHKVEVDAGSPAPAAPAELPKAAQAHTPLAATGAAEGTGSVVLSQAHRPAHAGQPGDSAPSPAGAPSGAAAHATASMVDAGMGSGSKPVALTKAGPRSGSEADNVNSARQAALLAKLGEDRLALVWPTANLAAGVSYSQLTVLAAQEPQAALHCLLAAAAQELAVLQGLRSQKRVITSTLAQGAASDPGTYRDLWGSFIVWVDEEDSRLPKPETPARGVVAQHAEVALTFHKSRGFGSRQASTADKARTMLDTLMKQLVQYLNANPEIVQNKLKYVAYGCRGDWPDVKPPEWSPVHDALQRPAPPTPAAPSGPQQA
ncbi:hypothetical protein QJQ45_017462, partial [Haematococcus lacustris]